MRILSKENCFRGVYTALVTPFSNSGKIDFNAWDRLLEKQITGGTQGIIPCGTTGESPTLSEAEKINLIEYSVKKCSGKIQVIAGTGNNDTAKTVEFNAKVSKLGVDACLVVTPYYNKPSQAGLKAHYEAIAEASQVPLILYNVPGRAVVSLAPATVAELALHEKIVGIKEASGNINLFLEMKEAVRTKTKKPFFFLSGDDLTFWPFLGSGGDGAISVAGNLFPNCLRMIFEDWCEGRVGAGLALFEKLLPLFETLFIEANPVPIKTILSEIGLIDFNVRLPLVSLTEENRTKLLATWNALLEHLKQDRPREDLRG